MYISDLIEKNKNRDFLQYKKQKANIIYFICKNDGTIIYVGKTSDIVMRVAGHGINGERFSRFRNKSVFYFFANNEDCRELEKVFILETQSKYNKQPKILKKKKAKIHVSVVSSKKEIKKLIRLCGGSRKKAAKTINIALGYIYRLEKGLKPSLRLYQDIVKMRNKLELAKKIDCDPHCL